MHVKIIADAKAYNLRFNQKSITIGRTSEADFAIPHPELSKNHCQLYFEGGDAFIVDNSSKNGIYVNGKRIMVLMPMKLSPSDLISLGKNIKLQIISDSYSDAPV